jgi:GGDEF domain-containing protein
VKQAMSGLEETIKASLRVGDVAAKYSDGQFVVLLPSTTEEQAKQVADRLVVRLYEIDDKYRKVEVRINIENVANEGKIIE